MKIELFGDLYVRKARLYPALLVSIPYLLLFWLISFSIFQQFFGHLAAAGIGVLPVAYFFSEFVRDLGKRAEDNLLEEWGGWPTTIFLRTSNDSIDSVTKARYINFFKKHIPQWRPPSSKTEKENPDKADEIYGSAIKWLKDNRRGEDYKILHEENASYGFRRNLYGSKIFAEFGCLLGELLIFYHSLSTYSQPGDKQLNYIIYLVSTAFSFLLIELIFAETLTAAWVRKAADNYALALLATCDKQEIN